METSTLDESQVEENRLSYEGTYKKSNLDRPPGPISSDTIFRTTSIGECNFNSNGFKKIDEKSIQMCQKSFKGKDKWSQKRCQGNHFGFKYSESILFDFRMSSNSSKKEKKDWLF